MLAVHISHPAAAHRQIYQFDIRIPSVRSLRTTAKEVFFMKQLKQQFEDSWHELKKTKVMAVTAMLIAIGVVLGFFSIQLTEFIRIGFPVFPTSWHRCCSVR